jgi:tetratricopeptide (TPR) repeat protein
VLKDVGIRQFHLHLHSVARSSFEQAIDLLGKNTLVDKRKHASLFALFSQLLGEVCVAQRNWPDAEKYTKEAIVAHSRADREGLGIAYHQLGRVTQAQRQWQQAEHHYQKALEIFVEFDDRYSQASTYHQLGIVAQEQRQWQQAEQHYFVALGTYGEFEDTHNLGICLRNIARLWKASGNDGLIARAAETLGREVEQTRKLFEQTVAEEKDEG